MLHGGLMAGLSRIPRNGLYEGHQEPFGALVKRGSISRTGHGIGAIAAGGECHDPDSAISGFNHLGLLPGLLLRFLRNRALC